MSTTSGYVILVLLATFLDDSAVETVADRKSTIVAGLQEPPEVGRHDDGMSSTRIEIEDEVDLYVIQEGEGLPLVLLNGGPGNSLQSFTPHFSRAAAFARVIYYDPRGVGQSSWEPGPAGYSTPQAIADLEHLRESLGIDAWVVLGWSWGGLLAQRYLIEHPERVRGLVLVASSESMGLETLVPQPVRLGGGQVLRSPEGLYWGTVERRSVGAGRVGRASSGATSAVGVLLPEQTAVLGESKAVGSTISGFEGSAPGLASDQRLINR